MAARHTTVATVSTAATTSTETAVLAKRTENVLDLRRIQYASYDVDTPEAAVRTLKDLQERIDVPVQMIFSLPFFGGVYFRNYPFLSGTNLINHGLDGDVDILFMAPQGAATTYYYTTPTADDLSNKRVTITASAATTASFLVFNKPGAAK